MPGSFLKNDLGVMYKTEEFAVPVTWAGRSFNAQFFIQDSPMDFWGNQIENAEAYIIASIENIGDIAPGVLVVIGTASDTGTGFADDMFIDITDNDLDLSGVRQFYVIGKKYYGDDGLQIQIFLSKDKP